MAKFWLTTGSMTVLLKINDSVVAESHQGAKMMADDMEDDVGKAIR